MTASAGPRVMPRLRCAGRPRALLPSLRPFPVRLPRPLTPAPRRRCRYAATFGRRRRTCGRSAWCYMLCSPTSCCDGKMARKAAAAPANPTRTRPSLGTPGRPDAARLQGHLSTKTSPDLPPSILRTSGAPDISTKTSRAFAQVSTATKMLVKEVLQASPPRSCPAPSHPPHPFS